MLEYRMRIYTYRFVFIGLEGPLFTELFETHLITFLHISLHYKLVIYSRIHIDIPLKLLN